MDEILWWKVESTGFEIEYLEKCISESYFNEGKLANELEKNIHRANRPRSWLEGCRHRSV
jgi:ribosomal protein S13